MKYGVKLAIAFKVDSKTMYNERCLWIKTRSYKDKSDTNLHNNGMPKEFSHCIF